MTLPFSRALTWMVYVVSLFYSAVLWYTSAFTLMHLISNSNVELYFQRDI